MPPKILKYQASFERLYGDVKALDLSKPATKKQFMELIGTFLKDEPIERKESAPVEPILSTFPRSKRSVPLLARPRRRARMRKEKLRQRRRQSSPLPLLLRRRRRRLQVPRKRKMRKWFKYLFYNS